MIVAKKRSRAIGQILEKKIGRHIPEMDDVLNLSPDVPLIKTYNVARGAVFANLPRKVQRS